MGLPRPLAAALLVLLAACDRPPAATPPLSLRRPAAVGVAWSHCALQRQGETRPAVGCPKPVLLAAATGALVPASRVLDVAIGGAGLPDGAVKVSTEVFTYLPPVADPLARAALENLDRVLESRSSDRLLEAALAGREAGMQAAPQGEGVYLDRVPASVALRFSADDVGRTVAYAVWAWPTTPAPALRVELEPLTPRPDDGLAISFGIGEPGWTPTSPAVTFSVLGGPAGEPAGVVWSRQIDPARRVAERGWLEDEVDLSRFAGREVRLALVAQVEGTAASFPVWAKPVLLAPDAAARARPNVLFISLDTVRADHLSAWGYDRLTSPGLAAFAGDGVLFEQAIAHFPSTTASHMSMLTSLQPCAHGVLAPDFQRRGGTLSPSATTLAEALSAAGWSTVAITEDALIQGPLGFDRGFDEYLDQVGRGEEGLGLFPEGIERAERWIERHRDRPWFMFLHTYQPHEPFKVPPYYRDLFPLAADAPAVRRLERDYDVGIRYTDDLLSNFLALLGRHGLLDDVLVVITSDHGTEFEEHGSIGHAKGVNEEQIHVPLVMRHPTLAQGGRRVPGAVALIDVAPTVLELLGVERPASFSGTSLVPLLRGEGRTQPVFSEQLWGSRQTLLRTDHLAWIQKASGLELYDVRADPHEQHDLAAERPDVAAQGGRDIAAFRTACAQQAAALKSAVGTMPAIDPERERTLRALGYLE